MARITVPLDTTRSQLRHEFALWGLDASEFEILWESELNPNAGKLAPGVQVRYLRNHKWQSISCFTYNQRAGNLRQVYMLINRLRIAEAEGVQYEGLTFSTAVTTTADNGPQAQKETLAIYYDFLGVDPTDSVETIKRVYTAKAMSYHPDQGGNPDKFKRLTHAYEEILKARGKK
jgi:hypothetical protein